MKCQNFGVVLVLFLQGMIIAQRLITVAVFTSLNHISSSAFTLRVNHANQNFFRLLVFLKQKTQNFFYYSLIMFGLWNNTTDDFIESYIYFLITFILLGVFSIGPQ